MEVGRDAGECDTGVFVQEWSTGGVLETADGLEVVQE